MNLDVILSKFEVAKSNGSSAQVKCPLPTHKNGDKNPSLTITEKDEEILFHCHAGCKTEEIIFLHPSLLW